jgi:hypothetical protein
MIINAKSELQEHISIISTTYGINVKCMECFIQNPDMDSEDQFIIICYLPCGYNEQDKQDLFKNIDTEYDDFYEDIALTLDGCIWWSDGSWSVRDIDEDSARELWVFCKSPPIPLHLKRQSTNNVVSLFGDKV